MFWKNHEELKLRKKAKKKDNNGYYIVRKVKKAEVRRSNVTKTSFLLSQVEHTPNWSDVTWNRFMKCTFDRVSYRRLIIFVQTTGFTHFTMFHNKNFTNGYPRKCKTLFCNSLETFDLNDKRRMLACKQWVREIFVRDNILNSKYTIKLHTLGYNYSKHYIQIIKLVFIELSR